MIATLSISLARSGGREPSASATSSSNRSFDTVNTGANLSMSDERLDTAHEYWDNWWGEAKHRARWSEPEPSVMSLAGKLRASEAMQVLDVGTGIGRHALAYAPLGFDVFATDASAKGLEEVARSAKADGTEIDV